MPLGYCWENSGCLDKLRSIGHGGAASVLPCARAGSIHRAQWDSCLSLQLWVHLSSTLELLGATSCGQLEPGDQWAALAVLGQQSSFSFPIMGTGYGGTGQRRVKRRAWSLSFGARVIVLVWNWEVKLS